MLLAWPWAWAWALLVPSRRAAQSPPRVVRIYTVASYGETSVPGGPGGCHMRGGWPEILRHFLASLAASPREAAEVRVLRFNASSPSLLRAVGGDLPLEAWSHSMYYSDSMRQGALNRPRWLAWHVAMFYKALSWARVARDPSNSGHAVLCADADHTFFPGWRRVIESCLERHELCFEANFKSTGTPWELRQASIALPGHTPNVTFWRRGWVNTGLFAMRCGPAAHEFWADVVRFMRLLFSRHGMASDQTTANAILRDANCSYDWGVLDPYAVSQISPYSLDAAESVGRKGLRTHVRRMLDEMRVHHAAYLGKSCAGGRPAADCKLQLMQRVNATWFSDEEREEGASQREPQFSK